MAVLRCSIHYISPVSSDCSTFLSLQSNGQRCNYADKDLVLLSKWIIRDCNTITVVQQMQERKYLDDETASAKPSRSYTTLNEKSPSSF